MRTCKLLKSIALFCIFWAWFAQAQNPSAVSPHVGLVQDWSSSRVIFDAGALTAQSNPRAIAFLHRNAPSYGRGNPAKNTNRASIDWSLSLGSGTIAADMSPAKYSFDVNATPNCVSDFVLYALNVAFCDAGEFSCPELPV